MLNYANLNDVEFEYLCQDIMSKKLGIELRRFAAGRDGGIDLADNTYNPNIIVQVKHYPKTDISGLINSLAKEVEKTKKLKPKQYYICCSKELSAARVSEIYSMFSEYMSSDSNVITIIEIDDFLNQKSNVDVLQKHYKLWIASTNILQEIYNNNIFLDCDSLLSSIDVDEKYYVRTLAYDKALICLSKTNTLLLIGDPGVGKTVTSKMLIFTYAAMDYRVRYTTDVTDLASLKKSLSQDRNRKEIILLDDCFGQAYFEMKSSQGGELVSLIKYVNASDNKILILNSRITIYQEAKKRTPELIKSLEYNEFKVQVVDMSVMPKLDKAKILYNHMYFNTNDMIFFKEIKKDNNYMKIIEHKNYNPRIIEFVTNPNRYKGIAVDRYFDFITRSLDNPYLVWDNEYEERIQMVDRCLLTTLFSHSRTMIPYKLAKLSFEKRVQHMANIDMTINQFERSLFRLQDSFLKIVDDCGDKKISMINPSINDYLELKLKSNTLEIESIIESAVSIYQYQNLLCANEFKVKLDLLFQSGQIINMYFEDEIERNRYIASYIGKNSFTNGLYKKYIWEFIISLKDEYRNDKYYISAFNILLLLFREHVFYFYEINELLKDLKLLKIILGKFSFENILKIIDGCYYFFENEDGFLDLCKEVLNESVVLFCNFIDATDYDVNIDKWAENNCSYVYYEDGNSELKYDIDAIIRDIEYDIEEFVQEDIISSIKNLPGDLSDYEYLNIPNIFVYEVENMVKSYLEDFDDDGGHVNKNINLDYDIHLMFNR